ncbi:MAG: glycosyltransferase family 4 protein [Chitinophagales bacterium]|nr:glycosyltransferase family 4 protein [Chitinophagales bacterium]
MRIGVNTRLLLKGKLEGIGWFTCQTLERMVHEHPEHDFFFFFDRPYDESFVFSTNVTPVVVPPQARHPILFALWFDWTLPYVLKKHKIDVFLSPDGFCSLRTPIPTCLVVHDLAFEHYPEHLSFANRYYWQFFQPKFANKAKRIVTVSEYSKQDMVTQYDIDPAKIDVACNGVHDAYRELEWREKEAVKEKYADGCEYFVFAGALHPRKNILNMLKAFVAFKKMQRSNMKLVIVGRFAWKYEEVLEMKENMPFKDDVKWVGYMNVDELPAVIGGAYAMLYPSFFEGFGIPILEALKCNVPAIVSNTSSMPEVAGEAGLLVNPADVEDIANKMEMLYKDEALRAKLIAHAPEQVAKFTWERASKVLWENMMQCVNK